MAFKKVNLRFKPAWTAHNLLLKLKFLWIFRFIIERKHYVLYIDEFNISDASFKSFNWSQRGNQDYWFSNRKLIKHNCIIAVSNNGPKNIHMQASSINAENFVSFVNETIDKLNLENKNTKMNVVLIFDNAPIHTAGIVEKSISKANWWALTLPPYTPEWNDAEPVINIIKQKLDRDLKCRK